MKAFLCSDYIHPEIVPDFELLIGRKAAGLSIAMITTAANPLKDKSWIQDDVAGIRETLGENITFFDVEKMSVQDMRTEFGKRAILWVNGGMAAYLMDKVRTSGLEQLLPDLLNTRGVIYVGSSAGSQIFSESLENCEWYIGEPESGASKVPGLGYLSFQIYPHFRDELLGEIQAHKPHDQEYRLLKNGQAISVDDNGTIQTHGGDVIILKADT